MIHYNFLTEWRLKAKPRDVWAVVDDVEALPQWWPGIKKVGVRGADKDLRPGTIIDFVVKGIIGDIKLVIEVVEILPNKKLLVKSNGSLKGFGLCTLEKNGAQTVARIRWEVASTGWLMNLAGLVIKPILKRNHDRVMAKGYQALRKRLEG